MTDKDHTVPYMVSSSPHAHSGASVQGIMLDVVIALIPAFAVSIFFFRWDAVRLVAVCIFACVGIEWICRKMMGRDSGVRDLSAVVTAILLAFNLPPTLPAWMAIVGALFAIAIAKQVFGGIGYNPFNPALVGRVALFVSCPVAMTGSWSSWRVPAPITMDAVTNATPLGALQTSVKLGRGLPFEFTDATALQFFLGDMNGCIGEVSAAALILGGIYLLVRRCISWHIPVAYIATVAAFAGILRFLQPDTNLSPVFHLLAGGLMLGAIFMATDMVTSPVTAPGKLVFGIGCGILTMVIRKWAGAPEGVSFAILLMNAATPLINRATRPRGFGRGKLS